MTLAHESFRHRDALLVRMIPAMSPAAGRIPVPKLTPLGSPEGHNFDMNGPDIRPNRQEADDPPWLSTRNNPNWRHSDLREVAYPYVRELYKRISTLGELDIVDP